MVAIGGTGAITFDDARQYCAARGKELPTPDSIEAVSALNGGLMSIYWTGYMWSEPLNKYINVYTGEPVSPAFEAQFLQGKDKSTYPNSALAVGFGNSMLIFDRVFDMIGTPMCSDKPG